MMLLKRPSGTNGKNAATIEGTSYRKGENDILKRNQLEECGVLLMSGEEQI